MEPPLGKEVRLVRLQTEVGNAQMATAGLELFSNGKYFRVPSLSIVFRYFREPCPLLITYIQHPVRKARNSATMAQFLFKMTR
jgi:hypothetical protein